MCSTRVFEVRRDRSLSPRTGREHDFFVLDAVDWVNVVPVTPDGQVVLIRQYRHGVEDFTLEVPGGMVDASDASPAAAARREMREETGFEADELISLGWTHPNPAIQGNRCFSFVAHGARHVAATQFDTTEETEVVLVPLTDVPGLIARGVISHALVVVAFFRQELRARGHTAPESDG